LIYQWLLVLVGAAMVLQLCYFLGLLGVRPEMERTDRGFMWTALLLLTACEATLVRASLGIASRKPQGFGWE
jgi:hypothetical protein